MTRTELEIKCEEQYEKIEQLEAEVARLRALLTMDGRMDHSHQCRKCLHPYSPGDSPNEDCPVCGHDGK